MRGRIFIVVLYVPIGVPFKGLHILGYSLEVFRSHPPPQNPIARWKLSEICQDRMMNGLMLEKIDLETFALGRGPRRMKFDCVLVKLDSLILALFVLVMLERHQRESYFPYRRVITSGGPRASYAAQYPWHVSREAVLQE